MQLSSINIPEGITSIGCGAFVNCQKLKTIQFPSTLQNLEFEALRGNYFEYIGVDEDNPLFSSVDGVLYSKDGTVLYEYPKEKTVTSFIVPYGVKTIEYCSFERCRYLESIVLPESVETINPIAFANCNNLSSVTLPQSLRSLGSNSFFGCKSLERIVIPNGVVKIGCAFQECSNLKYITLPNNLERIESYTFLNCRGLQEITLPKSLKVIDSYAFDGCNNLTDVYYAGTEADWLDINISYQGNSIIMVGDFGDNKVLHYRHVKDPVFFLPNSVVILEDQAFSGIAATSVVIVYDIIHWGSFCGKQCYSNFRIRKYSGTDSCRPIWLHIH